VRNRISSISSRGIEKILCVSYPEGKQQLGKEEVKTRGGEGRENGGGNSAVGERQQNDGNQIDISATAMLQ
jgi:hypothetical protein